jgi:predicted nuclease of predicted toxin-antitoxin system
VRFLVDEMFSPAVGRRLTGLGHDAVHVREVGLGGRPDDDVLGWATAEERVVITENAVDFVPLLDAAAATGVVTTPVVLALKRTLPKDPGAMANALAERLAAWADTHPDPYRHVHWLG